MKKGKVVAYAICITVWLVAGMIFLRDVLTGNLPNTSQEMFRVMTAAILGCFTVAVELYWNLREEMA